MLPLLVAVSVAIVEVPLMFSKEPVPWASVPPVPESAVPTVSVLVFVRVTPVTVTLGMENVPVSAWALVVKVYDPVPAVKVPLLLVTPPRKLIAEFPELFQIPPEFMITKPAKVFVPVVLAKDIVPLTLVVPVTVIVTALKVFVVSADTVRPPAPTLKFPVAEPPNVEPESVILEMP